LKTIREEAGYTLVEIMIVVLIIGMLATLAIPNFVRARGSAQTNVCINNLRLMSNSIDQFAMENNKVDTDIVSITDINPYLKATPACPAGGTYRIRNVATNPTCSIAGGHTLP
jgi:prepilin-type N-terminal cleavage/methylation domain-containing protein